MIFRHKEAILNWFSSPAAHIFCEYLGAVIKANELKLKTGGYKKFITYTYGVTQHPDGTMTKTPIGEIVDFSDSLRGQINALQDILDIPKIVNDITARRKKYEENPNKGAE